VDHVIQSRIIELIESELIDPPPTRARRLYEKSKVWFPSPGECMRARNDVSGWLVGATLFLPVLIPALGATVVEALQSRRQRAVHRAQDARVQATLKAFEAVTRERATEVTYRRSARPESLHDAPPEIVALCIEADRALLVRYTVNSPRDWQRNWAFEGVALVAASSRGVTAATNVWRVNDVIEASKLAAILVRSATSAITCPLESAHWIWSKGCPESLVVVPLAP
jgi:hypothetical protein